MTKLKNTNKIAETLTKAELEVVAVSVVEATGAVQPVLSLLMV